MASFDKTLQFFVLITSSRRITVAHLAKRMECTRRHIYRLIKLASSHIPIRLEQGVIIYEGHKTGIKMGNEDAATSGN